VNPPSLRTALLLRHAHSTANALGVLAGRADGIRLSEFGSGPAAALPQRLAGVEIARIVSSPLERCRATVAPLAAALGLPVEIDDRLSEVHYGAWTGRALSDLVREDLWRVVQQRPSAVVFPDGEGLVDVSVRAVAAVREHVQGGVPVLICSHGDVLKAVLADALGIHLDGFQRINVAPASLSVVRYSAVRPIVERINYTGDLTALFPVPSSTAAGSGDGETRSAGNETVAVETDAIVGGATS
jgi:probable phosphomutase (TIGR03848 family)